MKLRLPNNTREKALRLSYRGRGPAGIELKTRQNKIGSIEEKYTTKTETKNSTSRQATSTFLKHPKGIFYKHYLATKST